MTFICAKWRRRRHRRGAKISLLVPFTAEAHGDREAIWHWLRRYWRHELPAAQIVVGHDSGRPFSKTAAVNDAASRATGDVLVILDADAYLSGRIITECAAEIRRAKRQGRHLWFVPYRHFYRMNAIATRLVLWSRPKCPYRFDVPPPADELDASHGDAPTYGHHFAALIMVMPRCAFELVGGMDPRFRGWGGEDISFMRALDTLYGHHKTCNRAVFHLWHSNLVAPVGRRWEGQTEPMPFGRLGSRYRAAYGDPQRMAALVQEGF